MDAVIYTAYHKLAPLFSSPSIQPIHVGRKTASVPIDGMIGDDTGDNISERNDAFCELTALYWAWKNAPADKTHIGLMHYRRLLDLTDIAPEGPVEARVPRLDVAPWLEAAEAWLARSDVDVIVPRRHVMGRSVAENYRSAHQPQDFEAVREIIAADHPDHLASFDAVSAQPEVRLANMCLLRRDLMDAYCAWIFDILFKIEALPLDRSRYSIQQARYLGFLSERLFTVWIAHLIETNPGLTVREVSILNLADALVVPYADDTRFTDPAEINVALAADTTYLPHAAAMLRSVVDTIDRSRPLNVFLLHDGIRAARLDTFATILGEHPLATFHPLDTGGAFRDFYRSDSRAPSNATYNRFLLFSLLPRLKRLLYLDCDMIVLRDIAPLFDTEMDGAALAAVPDWIMTRTLTGPIPTVDPDVPDLSAYQREVLGFTSEQIARYVNAGVLLFSFEALEDPRATGELLIERARTGSYLFRDQDVLNAHFASSMKILDGRWNVFNSTAASYMRVPADNHAKAMAARAEPWIIHYADRDYKPWRAGMTPMAQHYWQALIRTPFYGEIVGRMAQNAARKSRARLFDRVDLVRIGRNAALRWPWLKRPLLKLYASLGASRG